MIVYHGSYIEIEDVDLSKCEPHKDFGQGFYVTKNKKHAETWTETYNLFLREIQK
jgi:hypothetical protein